MNWLLATLGNHVEILSGYPFKSELFNNAGNGLPLVRIRDVVPGESKTYYSGEYPKDFLLQNGDMLIGMDGDFNREYWRGGKALLNQRVCKITANSESLNKSYLYHFLPKALAKIHVATPAVTVKHLSVNGIRAIEIPLPPLEKQKRIAAILDKAYAIRCKRQETIKLADEFLRLMFLNMFGDPLENTKGWEVKKLKDLSTRILSGNTPSGGSAVYVENGITFFRSQNVWKNSLVLEDIAYIDEKTHKNMSKSSLMNRDILITKTGRINTENSSLGRAALYEGPDDAANINGHVYLIRLADKSLCEFILFILTSKEYREYIRSVCVGGIDKRQLNKEHLEQFPIILPPADLQKKFVDILRVVNLKKKRALQALDDSIELFDGLNQKAFSGKLN